MDLKERVLGANIFADIRLMKAYGGHGIGGLAVRCGTRQDAEAQRQVVHGVNHHALVLAGVLRDATQSGFGYVVAVEKLLLEGGLHPHLVLGVGRQVVERRDMELQFVGLGELAEAGAHAHQLLVAEALAQLQNPLRDVVDPILVLPKAICSIWPVNQMLHICANAVRALVSCIAMICFGYSLFGQVLEQDLGTFVAQAFHFKLN